MLVMQVLSTVDKLVAFVPEQKVPETIPHAFLGETVLVITLIGLVLGGLLAFAAGKFKVEENPLIEKVEDVLPKGQCGACGFAGCRGYAEAVALKEAVPANLCIPGGEKTATQVAVITGKSLGETVKVAARLKCTAEAATGAPMKFRYEGIADCAACNLFQGGCSECAYGCLGFGSCARACPFGAIEMKDGRPAISAERCTGCGICVRTCPRQCIEILPQKCMVRCRCNNPGKGSEVKKMCPSACIGCGLCAKKCPHSLITMENNLPVIQCEKCPPDCPMPCAEKCPTGALSPQKEPAQKAAS